jgi:hypothetical protein
VTLPRQSSTPMGDAAGSKAAARRAPACRWMPSAGRGTRRAEAARSRGERSSGAIARPLMRHGISRRQCY